MQSCDVGCSRRMPGAALRNSSRQRAISYASSRADRRVHDAAGQPLAVHAEQVAASPAAGRRGRVRGPRRRRAGSSRAGTRRRGRGRTRRPPAAERLEDRHHLQPDDGGRPVDVVLQVVEGLVLGDGEVHRHRCRNASKCSSGMSQRRDRVPHRRETSGRARVRRRTPARKRSPQPPSAAAFCSADRSSRGRRRSRRRSGRTRTARGRRAASGRQQQRREVVGPAVAGVQSPAGGVGGGERGVVRGRSRGRGRGRDRRDRGGEGGHGSFELQSTDRAADTSPSSSAAPTNQRPISTSRLS